MWQCGAVHLGKMGSRGENELAAVCAVQGIVIVLGCGLEEFHYAAERSGVRSPAREASQAAAARRLRRKALRGALPQPLPGR